MRGIALLLFFLLLLLLLAVTTTSSPTTRFDTSPFLATCGTTTLRTEYFRELSTHTPTLHPTANINSSVQQWCSAPENFDGYCAKLKFRNDTTHPIGLYMLRWLQQKREALPLALQQRLQTDLNPEYCLRFSNGTWKYPNHYDCIDNYALVLAGTRYVRLDRGAPQKLAEGSVLYIPAEQEHEFWCENAASRLQLLFNIDFAPREEGKQRRCTKNFEALWPQQAGRVVAKLEYT